MIEKIPDLPEDVVLIEGRKYKRRFVGDMNGLDGKPLTEKRYYSHTGPGWDHHFGYLENRGVDSLDQLSDDPYVYRLIEE
jgi:hypothetical protein